MMRKFLVSLSWEFSSRRAESGRYSSAHHVIRAWGPCMCHCSASPSIPRLDRSREELGVESQGRLLTKMLLLTGPKSRLFTDKDPKLNLPNIDLPY